MRPARREARRAVAAVLLASAAGLGLGCQAAARRRDDPNPRPTNSPAKGATKTLNVSAGINADPGVVRAGFEAKPQPGQEVGVRMELGRGHEQEGQLEAAAVDYQQALAALDKPGGPRGSSRSIAEQKATAHRKLAVVLDRLGKFGESDVHYKAALKLSPDDPKVWNNAGYSQYIQGRWDEAERTLKTAVKLAPGDAKVATNLGLALAAGGKTEEAFAVLTRAVGPAAAHANIGYVLAATGRRAEAIGHYRTALALQPGLAAAETALVQLGKTGDATAVAPALPSDNSVSQTSAMTTSAPRRGLFGQRQ
jgi:tetratricopeptide (TPR) repeat protein